MMEIESRGLSDRGPNRPSNEDSIGWLMPEDPLVRQRKGVLFVLADGLGGHQAGEVASSSAVQAVIEEYYAPSNHSRIEPALRHALQTANLRVHALGQRHLEYRSMGTTLIALALAGSHAYIAHVGDSRVYHWRDGRLSQLTADHSEVADLIRMRILSPDRVRDHPRRNVLTRTLGEQLIVRPDFLRRLVEAGDQFVLCSDGLWSEVTDPEIADILAINSPAEACQRLVECALARDCGDNVSVQVVKVLSLDLSLEAYQPRDRLLSGIRHFIGRM